jgi:RNA polymerase sigma factor (sigma-70 family)
MARRDGPSVLSDLRALFEGGLVAGLSDAELLERYAVANAASEAAFAVLVDRHGPMVWGVCRQILGDVHEAEDAFQATFLVVARQAERAPECDAVGRWIHGIARRVALRARAQARRRHPLGAILQSSVAGDAELKVVRAELAAVVDEEVARLPARYRAAVELCFLRGMTNEAAARELGWPVGTVKSRLARARQRLQVPLGRRGLAPAAVAALSAAKRGQAAPPAALVRATVWTVRGFTTAGAFGTFPVSVAILATGVIRAMFVKKVMLSMTAVAAMLVAGASVYAFQGPGSGGAAPAPASPESVAPKSTTPQPLAPLEVYRDPLAHSVADVVEILAERAGRLEGEKRYSEAQAVVVELADVVGQWAGRLGGSRHSAKPPVRVEPPGSPVGTSDNNGPNSLGPVAGGIAGPSVAAGPGGSAPPPPTPVADPSGPAGESVEQRLARVEQQLAEILKRLDGRAERGQLPKGPGRD